MVAQGGAPGRPGRAALGEGRGTRLPADLRWSGRHVKLGAPRHWRGPRQTGAALRTSKSPDACYCWASWAVVAAFAFALAGCGPAVAPTGGLDTNAADTARGSAVDGVPADGDAASSADAATPSDAAIGDSGSSSSLNINDFCQPWAKWACQRALQCGCTTPKSGAPTEALCLPWMTEICAKDLQKITSAMQLGTVAIDPSRVPACIAWLDQELPACVVAAKKALGPGPCAEWLHQPLQKDGTCQISNLVCPDGSGCVEDQCGAARVGDGAPCKSDSHCKSMQCDGTTSTCKPILKLGSPCADGDSCPLLTQCSTGKCTGPAKVGAPCQSSADCELMLTCAAGNCAPGPKSCTAGQDCGGGGSCLGPVFNSCKAQLPKGAPCTQDEQCSPALWCDPGSGSCVARPGVGAPCANGVLCGLGLGCHPDTQLCVPVPKKGEPCAMSEFGPMLCGEGLVCKTDAFVCADPPLEGASCNHHGNCSPSAGKNPADLVCAFGPTGSSCVKRQPKGAKCENDICAPGLFCDSKVGACAPVFATGQSCSAGNECGLAGTCVPDDQGKLRCVPMPQAGGACLLDCAEGLFCSKGLTQGSCQPPVCALFYTMQ